MIISKGDTYVILFSIDGKDVMCSLIFSGESVELDGKTYHFFKNPRTNAEHVFTEENLRKHQGLNDGSARLTTDVIEL